METEELEKFMNLAILEAEKAEAVISGIYEAFRIPTQGFLADCRNIRARQASSALRRNIFL